MRRLISEEIRLTSFFVIMINELAASVCLESCNFFQQLSWLVCSQLF